MQAKLNIQVILKTQEIFGWMAKLFKVTKNDNSPFIVHTKGFDVKYWELSSMLMSERSIKLFPLKRKVNVLRK
jgi:hypothetical protein